jgi:hypothetical protein
MLKKHNKTAAVARSNFIRMMQSFLHKDKPKHRSVYGKKSCEILESCSKAETGLHDAKKMAKNAVSAVLSQQERNWKRSVKKSETLIVYKVELFYTARNTGGHYVEGTRQKIGFG